ncbi:Crp/Fnr family transcriptional regulator [Methylobacterium sp. C25]|uniref:Crp/Fnr family transcriptional regulator n=1 Tax=Methylobacterium sp. C25 TaxID=2721622 RepID=UPI001F364C64|nr:Crp/Fnr family transcriptional regulator [Methylobacterium sp. C25]MCE4225007.1 Crp/Fnr family transcriptional regulator [Methylobacterium sp. C25]
MEDTRLQRGVGIKESEGLPHSAPRNRLLSILDPDDLALLVPALEQVPLALNQVLIAANEPIGHAYFIEDGLISLVAATDRRETGRIEVGIVGYEGFVGVPLVLGADQSPHMGLVQGEGHGLRIAAADLQIAMHRSPSLRGVLGRFVQSLIVQVGQTVYANADLDIEGRLARWILMSQDRLQTDDLPLTHVFLSLMLGVRRPSVTMATQTLEEAGMIKARRGHIVVRDRDKLGALVGDTYGLAEAEYERLLKRA